VTAYQERLVAPPLVWLGAVGVALLAAGAVHAGGEGARAVLPYVLLPVIAVLAVAASSRGTVRVVDGVLHVPRARIPLAHVGEVTPLDREGTRQVRGPLAEPRAFVVTRPWLPGSVRVQVDDPADDTPYWLVGTRDPEALAQALQRGRTTGA
jgi:hypothetical protein